MTHDPHPHAASRAPDPLESRLQDWRRRQDARIDHGALVARVVEVLRTDDAIVTTSPAQQPRNRWIERTAWFTAGLAAAVTVAWIAWPERQEGGPGDWPPIAGFAAGQLSEKTALMTGMEATFGDGLAWIAEHDQRIDVGLAPDGAGGGEPVAVRIILLTRRAGETTWRPAWQSDVLARDEQVVDVAAGPIGAGRLRLWSHALLDGAYAIDGELTLAEAAFPLRASYSGVQRPGEPRRVAGQCTSDVEWQIIQTVMPLESSSRPQGEVG